MDLREQKGLMLAATRKITRRLPKLNQFSVPSETDFGTRYAVNLDDAEQPTCTCPDFETRHVKCKHIHAATYVLRREENPDGTTTVTETLTVTETVEKTVERKTTYPQNWTAYNAAQSVERHRVQELLAELVRGIAEPARTGKGRKPHSVRDSIYAMVMKVYSTFSARRFSCDLKDAHANGFLSREIPGLKVPQFFENAAYAPILNRLVHLSSLPLRSVETDFAVDSSGFGSSRFETWIDAKYGTPRRQVVWVKAHIACGVKTNVVTAVRILDKHSADNPQFLPLMNETKDGGFTIGEVSADKAYCAYESFESIAAMGGEPYIAFRANTTGQFGGKLEKSFHYFQLHREEYLAHYHKRSNVESTFSMIKRKFGGEVRSKTDAAMVNEVLCKLVAHNLCVLVQEQHELGIESVFWKEEAPELKVLAI